jgi:hypothetical protein
MTQQDSNGKQDNNCFPVVVKYKQTLSDWKLNNISAPIVTLLLHVFNVVQLNTSIIIIKWTLL